jgi:Ca-activated chloride channel family protein
VPTTNHAAVISNLELLTPQGGTNIAQGVLTAVRVAVSSLRASGTLRDRGGYRPAAIVLMSDGAQDKGNITPFEAGRVAGQAGVRIYAVGIGTPRGVVVDGKGLLAKVFKVPSDPDVVGLLARESGGQAYEATNATAIDTIYRQLGANVTLHEATSEIGPWLDLAAAVLLASSLLLGRARGAALP